MTTVADSGPGYRITGLREAVRTLERFGVETQDLKQAFGQIAATVVTEARQEAPKLTGTLAGSIRPGTTKNKAVVRAGYGSRVQHAGPIHYGWPAHNIRPTYFLTEPANRDTARHIDFIEAELDRLITRLNLT